MPGELLILFTRYPVAGQTKTRLIPALGAEGAAQLQRQMTAHTLAMAQQCRVAVQVCFCGGTIGQMRDWLGDGPDYQPPDYQPPDYQPPDYQPQGEGDLGDRMTGAFKFAFGQGYDRVVIIGTDCPGIDADLVRDGWHRLRQKDLVFGVASDGGYYLVGMRRLIPEIFQDIPWSSELVLSKTLTIVDRLDFTYDLLKTLSDIDRPEDLEGLCAFPSLFPPSMRPQISPEH
jgi:uncharacterized protein